MYFENNFPIGEFSEVNRQECQRFQYFILYLFSYVQNEMKTKLMDFV